MSSTGSGAAGSDPMPLKHMITVFGVDSCKNTVSEKQALSKKKVDWGFVDCNKDPKQCARFGASVVHPVTVVVGWDKGLFKGIP